MRRYAAPAAATAAVASLLIAGGRDDPAASEPVPVPGRTTANEAVTRQAVLAAARRGVAREVIAGRLRLAEAAAVFGRLQEKSPFPAYRENVLAAAEAHGLAAPPDPSADDLLCLQVMMSVRSAAAADCPRRLPAVSADLAEQLRAARAGRPGGYLPAVDDATVEGYLARADDLPPRQFADDGRGG